MSKTYLSTFFLGALFAVGLGVSGMTNPNVILSFLTIGGDWNPSLIFVMTAALAVHAVSFKLIMRRPSPLFARDFKVPGKRPIDRKLVVGSALFGIGWGLAGYCPAPAITSLASLRAESLLFVSALLGGMFIYDFIFDRPKQKKVLK